MSQNENAEGYLGLLALAGLIIWGGYSILNSNSLIPHEQEAVITASSDWIVGQSKECISVPIDPSWQDPKNVRSLDRLVDDLNSLSEDDRRARLGRLSPQNKAVIYILIQNRLQQLRHLAKMSSTHVVNCDTGSEHDVRITFYGNIDIPNGRTARWKCVRADDSFKCYEVAEGPGSVTDEDMRQAIAQQSSAERVERQIREMEAQPEPPSSPSGYVFSIGAWQKAWQQANPSATPAQLQSAVAAAKAAAITQHFEVVP